MFQPLPDHAPYYLRSIMACPTVLAPKYLATTKCPDTLVVVVVGEEEGGGGAVARHSTNLNYELCQHHSARSQTPYEIGHSGSKPLTMKFACCIGKNYDDAVAINFLS